jgi:uncharacterized glyoxalase superfamily protein PhnB
MIPPTIVTNLGISALVAAAAFMFGVGTGYRYEKAVCAEKFAAIQAEQQKALQDYQIEFQAAMERQIEARDKAEKEKEHAIKTLKHDYERRAGSRLYVSADCPKATGQTTASSTSVADAGTTTPVLIPERTTEDLYRLSERADTLVEQFRALQHWILYQGLYAHE